MNDTKETTLEIDSKFLINERWYKVTGVKTYRFKKIISLASTDEASELSRPKDGYNMQNNTAATEVLSKYKIVDGNRIIAKNLEEVKELVENEVSELLGVMITYAPESRIKDITTKIIDMIKKHKYSAIAIFIWYIAIIAQHCYFCN